jgi:hypothetical protein
MGWKIEIYRSFFIAIGSIELICNARYLLGKNGLDNARKQHRELPSNVSDRQIKVKTILMFFWGAVFFLMGLLSYVFHQSLEGAFILCLSIFTIYACVEAIYYKFRNTFGFAILSIALLLIYIFV